MIWRYISILKFQRCTAEIWEWISNFIYNGYNYLSMLVLKLIRVGKRGRGCLLWGFGENWPLYIDGIYSTSQEICAQYMDRCGMILVTFILTFKGYFTATLTTTWLSQCFKNSLQLLNLRVFKFPLCIKYASFNVWIRYCVWNFKFHTKYLTRELKKDGILTQHWIFKSS